MSWRRLRGGGGTQVRIGLASLAVQLLVLSKCHAFLPNFWSQVLTLSWDSYTHQYMTEQAVLNVTMETLSMLPGQHHSDIHDQAGLGRGFWRSVREVVHSNAAMDFLSSTRSDPVYHFDSERVEGAMEMLREFWAQTVLLAKAKEYQGARHNLGQLFHSLQDFYSHSNWVEMGQRSIYLHLLNPKEPAMPIASEDTPTCSECHGLTCKDNLLKLSTGHPLLTTGYFSSFPAKPAGKCSHGGLLDSSRHREAQGGINKDSTSPFFSPHHYLHVEAAHLATMATLAVLRDLRDAIGAKSFLRLFSVKQPPALVFVMDTTGSMFEEISAARLRAYSIIQARNSDSTNSQPGTFILVPFHDPTVGPVYETEDPEQFLYHLQELTALGGGDEPEMCLTAIQLALMHSPPLSEIFVFTDASPKDAHLYDAVKALSLEKQSKVTFLLTEDLSRADRRIRRQVLSPDRFSLYTALSAASGGLTVFTSNTDIHKVSAIVQDSIAARKVTLLHAESDSSSSHSFRVDSNMKAVTVHVTGTLSHLTLHSPTGRSQVLPGPPDPLAELEQLQGLHRVILRPPIESGQWIISAKARGPVTFNILGDSSLDFIYYFALEANKTHPGLAKVEGSPIAGLPVFLVLAVTGLSPYEEPTFSHVTLLGATGVSLQSVLLNSSSSWWSSEEELVGRISAVPREPFSLRLSGADGKGNRLERVSTEMIQPTHVQIQVLYMPRLVPGHRSAVPFNVWNHGPARTFTLSAEDNRGYLTRMGPHRFFIHKRASKRGEVELKTPRNAEAGVAVTLTLMIRALDSADSNYAVVHLTVIPLEPDTSPPSCSAILVENTCPQQCSRGNWSVTLAVTDRGYAGLAAVQLSKGDGTLLLFHEDPVSQGHHEQHMKEPVKESQLVQDDPAVNVSDWSRNRPLRLSYTSSCCASRAELLVWDRAGNMRRCLLTSSLQRAWQQKNGAASPTSGALLSLVIFFCLLQEEVC
ncbi:LOW QUALITY PROTEIN: von Willebrand factor A domain-containing protein 7-like [Denticeps clupeoides]|uniref:LOW QUALITY PROTEIN: von Willebrand factor A domain-containing protein 7-like n=1 Tax=Denticeps clupeoides TaxID=299321 RepID=UPI0010A54A80|nr:LOW QUALITY PROTEIN: von Willebrand factor A domain-containing protein 7-like [Denticeps clupeoides]